MPDVRDDIAELLGRAGLTGSYHAVDVDSGHEVGSAEDEPVVAASTFKLAVLVELCRQVEDGELDPARRLRIPAGRRTIGPAGLAVMRDEAELSVRDLAYLMIAVSDNHATDVLLAVVGLDRVNATMQSLGLPGTRLVGDCDWLFRTVVEDLGTDYDSFVATWDAERDRSRLLAARALTPERTNRTTPRELTTLLSRVWRDELLSPPACAEIRWLLSRQVATHRLVGGFPDPATRVSGKTGTMLDRRAEAGVVEPPDGTRYAVAVFVQHRDPYDRELAADAAIGEVARLAVDHLRRP